MKKQLLAGTAIAAACVLVAGGAAAQDKKMMKPSISVNGYYEGVVGGILDEDMGADTSALDTRTDAEIHFNGRGSLDNGMKLHARVELEGQNNHSQAIGRGSGTVGDPIDEYFIKVSGSFGSITLGGTAGAPVKMLTGMSGSWATGVGENLSFDDGWVPSEGTTGGQFHRIAHSRLDTGDAEKVTYISPKFGGFQVGMTYSPRRANHDDNV
ncbi:MAG: porin, partial [Defluviicoccus sp.]|nr:porin [Defluviicoccus sp.]